jgi:hypothetical protein
VDDAVRTDDYPAADRLLKVAIAAAGRAKVVALSSAIAARTKDVDTFRKAFEALGPDRKTLAADPKDPGANARVGRFVCLVKGDWETGLPLLVKGDDEKLKAAAAKDLTNPDTTAARVEAGDAWWDLADGLDPALRVEAKLRACFWYEQAAPELTGLSKARVDKRVAEAVKLAEQRPGRTGWRVILRSADPSIWGTDTNKGRDQFAVSLKKVPPGIRYLKMTETAKGTYVVIEMARDRLGVRTERDGYGWNGENKDEYKGHHLGVYDITQTRFVVGGIAIYHAPNPPVDYRGWGFGHKSFKNDGQGYSWGGEPVEKTVFEIAVKTSALTPEETKHLLKRK